MALVIMALAMAAYFYPMPALILTIGVLGVYAYITECFMQDTENRYVALVKELNLINERLLKDNK